MSTDYRQSEPFHVLRQAQQPAEVGNDDAYEDALADGCETSWPADDAAHEAEKRQQVLEPAHHGLRLDKLLTLMAPEFSRSYLQSLIARGCVQVQGETADLASRKMKAGQVVVLTLLPTQQSQAFRAEARPLAVVFEDEHVLVLNKPAGWVVHPAAGNWSGTLMNAVLAHHAAAAALPRAGIVHRLDKDTSGLMVLAKTAPAMFRLTAALASRTVSRQYMALAHGMVPEILVVDAPVGRDPRQRTRMAVVSQGKQACTDFSRLAWMPPAEGVPGGVSAVWCRLHTGRTHQIRVHLSHRGYPLLADGLYGGRPALGMERQALHAARLSLEHPATGEIMCWEAPPPPDMLAAWLQVGAGGSGPP
jgi:23S rRNA pseudouridine1911/1915/1917 synthase